MADTQNDHYMGSVVDARLGKDDKGKKYTSYVVDVKPPWFYHSENYKICRRYREFHALHSGLVKTFGKNEISCVFPKKTAGKNKPTVVGKRQSGFQDFLTFVSNHSRAGGHKLVTDFYTHRSSDPPKKTTKSKSDAQASHSSTLAAPPKKQPAKNEVVAGKNNKKAAAAMAAAKVASNPFPSSPPTTKSYVPDEEDDTVDNFGLDADHTAEAAVTKKGDLVDPVTAKSMSKSPSVGSAGASASVSGNPFLSPESTQKSTDFNPFSPSAADVGYLKIDPHEKKEESDDIKPQTAVKEDIEHNDSRVPDSSPVQKTASTPSTVASPTLTAVAHVAAPIEVSEDLPPLNGLSKETLDEAENAERTGDFGGAIDHYSSVLSDITEDDSLVGWRLKLLSARSNCYLQTGQARKCCLDCDAILTIQPSNTKALLYRGKGYMDREKLRDSFTDYQSAALVNDSNKAAAMKGMNEVSKMLVQSGDSKWIRENRKI